MLLKITLKDSATYIDTNVSQAKKYRVKNDWNCQLHWFLKCFQGSISTNNLNLIIDWQYTLYCTLKISRTTKLIL